MSEHKYINIEEEKYLEEIINLIKLQLSFSNDKLEEQRSDLILFRKEMWENTTHSSADFDKLSDLNQYLSALQSQTFSYTELAKRIAKYEKMIDSPYFARIDFTEEGYDDTEKIYIGLFSLVDEKTHDIKVYDWRAPISSLYYRYEIGKVKYSAPGGIIKGDVSLKRQYKINRGKIDYFIDVSVNIIDDMLMEALSKNMTSKMKTIVETIQKQQDIIIRDMENDLLIVQGIAGSGKSSVALHRIAYLLYQNLNIKLSSKNILIISPNQIFAQYISNVLPELGEEKIQDVTFENIFYTLFENKASLRSRSENFEYIISCKNNEEKQFLRSIDEFKGSLTFIEIINRFIKYYEKKLIPFEDIYFNGATIEKKELLKSLVLSNKLKMPTNKKLKIIEGRILDKIRDKKVERREKIERAISNLNNHEFEVASFTRVLSAKETSNIINKLHNFTEVKAIDVYKKLFSNKTIFKNISKGLVLPHNIDKIIDYTNKSLDDIFNIPYSDGIALLYLKLSIDGSDLFKNIKHTVVDEAQDYYHIHYSILKMIFKESKFTVVGDVNQTLEKNSDLSFYDEITKIFGFQKSNKIVLNKSYRSSYEISKFSEKLLSNKSTADYFKRDEEEVELIKCVSKEQILENIALQINKYKAENFKSIAVVCKNRKKSREVYETLTTKVSVKLIDLGGEKNISGTSIIPVYLAKGLEFDCVIVYEADDSNFNTEYDKKLLYISCTRALHRLSLMYSGKLSRFLK